MLSPETEYKLANFFYQILSGEKKVEEARFSLSKHRDFEISSAFKELDRIGMGSISSNDIRHFLEKNRISCTSQEAYLIIRQYDSNSDGRLSLAEFKELVLPRTLPFSSQSHGKPGKFSLDAEFFLTKLLEAEVDLQRTSEKFRKEIIKMYDFNLMEGFRSLDKRNQALIDENTLHVFLRRNGFSVVEMDMEHILKRIDKDKDGVISYVEFVDFLLPSEPNLREKSPSKSMRMTSPLKSINSSRQDVKVLSPEKEVYVSNYSPLRSSPLRSSMLSSNKDNTQRTYSPTMKEVNKSGFEISTNSIESSYYRERNSSPLRGNSLAKDNSSRYTLDDNEIVQCFKEEIQISREIEALKNELTLKADFNLIDAFRMFDLSDKGTIDLSSIEDFTTDFSLRISREEIYLLIRHFSHLQDSFLRFSDFTEIFTPNQDEYARLLRNRSAYNLPYSQRRRVFSRDTLVLFLDSIKMILNAESNSERLRQKLAKSLKFNLQNTFTAIDRDGDGYISVEELRRALDEQNMYPTAKDLKSLMQKFDKNKDGRVSFSEFIQEVTPKSPQQHLY